ncbi:hypothetical protein V8E36_005517 [Tilletia maclaganii]
MCTADIWIYICPRCHQFTGEEKRELHECSDEDCDKYSEHDQEGEITADEICWQCKFGHLLEDQEKKEEEEEEKEEEETQGGE